MSPQPSKGAVEALAKFEFERLERGDLRVKGGPVPWEKCEEALREEMLDWARDALQDVMPLLYEQFEEEVRERLLEKAAIHSLTKQIVEGSDGEVLSLAYDTVRDALADLLDSTLPTLEEGEK